MPVMDLHYQSGGHGTLLADVRAMDGRMCRVSEQGAPRDGRVE